MKQELFTSTPGDLSTGRFVYHRGERCGYVLGDTFVRNYNSHLHILRKFNALSYHRSVLAQLHGVRWLLAIDETGRQRWAKIEEFKRHGIRVDDPIYGPQIALPLRAWRPAREETLQDDQGPDWIQGGLL